MTTLIVLTKPLSPILYEPISFMILEVDLVPKPFRVPNQHIVIHLHAFCKEKNPAQPVRNPCTAKHLMIYFLLVLSLRLNVLEKDNLKEWSLEKNVD